MVARTAAQSWFLYGWLDVIGLLGMTGLETTNALESPLPPTRAHHLPALPPVALAERQTQDFS